MIVRTKIGLQAVLPKIFWATVILVLLALTASEETSTNSKNAKWARKILDVLKARDSITEKFTTLTDDVTTENIEDLISSLIEYPSHFKGINNLDVSKLESDRSLLKDLFDLQEEPSVKKYFQSNNLESNYVKRGLGFMLKTFKGYHGFRCLQEIYSPAQDSKGFDLPLQQMCSTVKKDLGKPETYTYSTAKICKSANECAGKDTPHPFLDSTGTSTVEACTDEENKCNVVKALPMMGALLWYKASDFIAQSLCSNTLDQPDASSLDQKLKDVESMAQMVIAYAATLRWKDFFTQAVQKRAYSDLGQAMTLIEERIKSIDYASLACRKIQATDLCPIGDINKVYQSLKGLKKTRDTERRDLHREVFVDHGKMVELKQDAVRHIELLGNIRSLDENLRTAVKGISKYFHGLADYDQRIGEADVGFLEGKLRDYNDKSKTLSEKLEYDIQAAMAAMLTGTIASFIEQSVILKMKIAENMHPAKAIFGEVSPGDIYEQAADVAKAAADVAHAIALRASLGGVLKDAADLTTKFKDNADQITGLQTLIDGIKTNTIEDLDDDVDKFITAYGDYTPKVDRSDLEKNDALWGAFKDTTCDLLMNAEGVAASINRGVVGGMLLCEKLEGTLAEFAALRENIFDFQFDLVDSLARVVRGNVAKKLSKSITVTNDLLDASKLLLGFLMTQYRLQSEAFLYCDKLEYRNQGRKVTACNIKTEYFTSSNLDDIVAYDPLGQYHEDEKFVYIPTKPQYNGDTGVINLQSLAEGNEVIFEIPRNTSWLRRYNWLSSDERLAPFVSSFKLYLPLKSYDDVKNRKRHMKTNIYLKPMGSFVSEDSSVVYNLPPETSVYRTTYEEGYHPSLCTNGHEMTNPYSLCGNLPPICDTLKRVVGGSLMPTILTTWKLRYTVESGRTDLKWDVPAPATNLLIIAKVRLHYPGVSSFRKKRSSLFKRSDPAFGCCTDNKYRKTWNDATCSPCPSSPTASQSELGGYYCKKGNEKVAGEPLPRPTSAPPGSKKTIEN